MKSMLNKTAILLIFLTFAFIAPTLAAEQTVTTTVTPKLISVSVSPTSINYGTVSLGGSAISGVVTATNNGTVAEDFDIKGATASSGSYQWSLVPGTPGANQFRHSFALDPYSSYIVLDTANVDFSDNISASGSKNFKLKIELPSSIAGTYTQYTTSVTITATEHL